MIPGAGVGEYRCDAQPVGVGEGQSRTRVGTLFAEDQPQTHAPAIEFDHVGGLGHSRALPDPATTIEGGMSTLLGDHVDDVLDAGTEMRKGETPTEKVLLLTAIACFATLASVVRMEAMMSA